VSFAGELREPAFAPRDIFAERASRDGTRALKGKILMIQPDEYSSARKGSATKRATLRMFKSTAGVIADAVRP